MNFFAVFDVQLNSKCQARQKWKFRDSSGKIMTFSMEDQESCNIIKTSY
jgi:hypothetical protein